MRLSQRRARRLKILGLKALKAIFDVIEDILRRSVHYFSREHAIVYITKAAAPIILRR